MGFLINLFLHLDVVLRDWAAQYGTLIYGLLFLIVFLETGLVVTPFLPGDSLLFASGAVAAVSGGHLNVWILMVTVFTAAALGDMVNYAIGRTWGRRMVASRRLSRVIKPAHLARTEAFFARHGGKTVSLARFVPYVRTLAPFVAGISRMKLASFLAFNLVGGAAWVVVFVMAGYLFGNIPFVVHNLQYLVIAVVIVSVIPAFLPLVRRGLKGRRERGRENVSRLSRQARTRLKPLGSRTRRWPGDRGSDSRPALRNARAADRRHR